MLTDYCVTVTVSVLLESRVLVIHGVIVTRGYRMDLKSLSIAHPTFRGWTGSLAQQQSCFHPRKANQENEKTKHWKSIGQRGQ